MTEGTMQYLVSLSDKSIEMVIELEKLYGLKRDEVIESAIRFTYESNHPLSDTQMREYRKSKSIGEAAQNAASNIAMALLQRTLDEGRSIHIPSLGITIGPKDKKDV